MYSSALLVLKGETIVLIWDYKAFVDSHAFLIYANDKLIYNFLFIDLITSFYFIYKEILLL